MQSGKFLQGNGSWFLVLGYWFLVLGYWLLVIGYWLLRPPSARGAEQPCLLVRTTALESGRFVQLNI
jgi:hypothetical protein